MIADRIQRIEESSTLRISAKAKSMKAEGIDVIDFSVGEPDFPTPEHIREAAKRAIDQNITKYTANDGIPELKKAILNKLQKENNLAYGMNQILVSAGAKHSLYNVAIAMFNKDEEVIIPAPYWVSYPQQALLAKAKPVIVDTKEENGFKITPDELKAYINFNTKALILNNPSNPTGAGYTRKELEALAEIVLEEGIYVIADEIYEKITYDSFQFVSFASLSEEIKKRTVVINGVSKAYSMTGWRIGYAAGSKELISAMSKVQSHATSNASSISQMASLAALNGPQFEVSRMVAEFQKRRNYLLQKLHQIPGISCYEPEGAFYLFPNTQQYFNKEYKGTQIRNSYGLSYYLLNEAHVAIVPGDAFGAQNYIRISYATSMANIEEGIERIGNALADLKESPKLRKRKLNNSYTNIIQRTDFKSDISTENRDALVGEAESYLPYNQYYEWNANINGIIIQLRTNSQHLYNFWVESWYPAELESDLEPHGIIYAIMGVPGRQPFSYYHPETKTAVIFNSDYFKQVKSWAFGMVADISERLFDVHSVRGSAIDVNGKGIILIGPKGTPRIPLQWTLLRQEGFRFHSDDWMFLRYRKGEAVIDNAERKVYLETKIVKHFPEYAELFDRCACENVITEKKFCTDLQCQLGECGLDHGEPFCYWGGKDSRALLDPAWIHGHGKYTKRTYAGWLFILKDDDAASPVTELTPDNALQILEEGKYRQKKSGDIGGGTQKTMPYFNPYLLVNSEDRLNLQKRYFHYLLKFVPAYLINCKATSLQNIAAKIKSITGA